MKATDKAPAVENLLTSLTGSYRPTAVAQRTCVMCKGSANEFKDDLSRREYTISGLCQKCQDQVFSPYDESKDQ